MAKKSGGSTSNIKINTTKVSGVIDKLINLNQGMETDFDNIVSTISKMDSSWDGAASNNAISRFNKVKSDCKSNNGRKAVINQYIRFLQNNVDSDYETTEKTNTELARLFK